MALTTKQKGIAVEIESRPGFTGYINIDFPETDKFRERDDIIGEEGKRVTALGLDSTQEVPGKLVVKSGTTLPAKFDVLSESSPSTRKWLIEEIGRPREAGKKIVLDVKLTASEGLDLSL